MPSQTHAFAPERLLLHGRQSALLAPLRDDVAGIGYTGCQHQTREDKPYPAVAAMALCRLVQVCLESVPAVRHQNALVAVLRLFLATPDCPYYLLALAVAEDTVTPCAQILLTRMGEDEIHRVTPFVVAQWLVFAAVVERDVHFLAGIGCREIVKQFHFSRRCHTQFVRQLRLRGGHQAEKQPDRYTDIPAYRDTGIPSYVVHLSFVHHIIPPFSPSELLSPKNDVRPMMISSTRLRTAP